ncbi:type II toxin-antitoxin system HicB family antitoxin [Candidatus Uhrbacteria bacterium]|nr:type II toxin-antitoxin system HicB family antitoxin [Candidatus Uhrbacteria bacterium]
MKTTNILTYTVLFEHAEEGGYVTYAPLLPGCHSQGETLEEAESNIQEAIEVYLESLREHGEEAPVERKVLHGSVTVSATA